MRRIFILPPLYAPTMPHKRISDDIDHVPVDPKPTKKPRKKPPEPWTLPAFEPVAIADNLTYGQSQLPDPTMAESPYAVFSLFFIDDILAIIRDHTNEYAQAEIQKLKRQNEKSRSWKNTSIGKLKTYLKAYVWISVHEKSAISNYWNSDPNSGLIHIRLKDSISLIRWQQIKRFLHISKPHSPDLRLVIFKRLKPLNSRLRRVFKLYWLSETYLTGDETIARFMGRAKEIVNISAKLTSEGFKVWVLVNSGYVLDWLFHAKGAVYEPYELSSIWVKKEGFSKTQAVILTLAERYDKYQWAHIIWLNNLFTSANLLARLRELGYEAADTVRTTKTEREKEKESHETAAQKRVFELGQNRGLNPILTDLKLNYNSALLWGALYEYLIATEEVLQLAWKDQNVVLFMITVNMSFEKVMRKRKKPAITAINSATSRAIFDKNEYIKDLAIPRFIDNYNHFMNEVD